MKDLFHHINHLTIYAIILLAVGLSLRYVTGKRKFNRRGTAGMQYFKTYSQALVIITIEKVLNFIGTLLIIGAVILYLIR